jgi:hypothetical protein
MARATRALAEAVDLSLAQILQECRGLRWATTRVALTTPGKKTRTNFSFRPPIRIEERDAIAK